MYLLSRSSCSHTLAFSRISASGIDLRGDLVSGYSCKLVPSSIPGYNFAVLHCTRFQPTSWISSHFPVGASVAKVEILGMLQEILFVLSIGILRFCGDLWSTL